MSLETPGRCLNVIGNGAAPGTNVQLWDCNGAGGQVWRQQPDGSLLNPQSGLCLDDWGGVTTNGAWMQIWYCSNQAPPAGASPGIASHQQFTVSGGSARSSYSDSIGRPSLAAACVHLQIEQLADEYGAARAARCATKATAASPRSAFPCGCHEAQRAGPRTGAAVPTDMPGCRS